MGNGFTKLGSAATGSEEDMEKGIGGLKDPGQNSKTLHIDSDSSASNSSNGAEDRTASNEEGEVMGIPVQKLTRKILIVDDETAIADTLSLIFQLRHYAVRVAYSAEAAIEIISEWCPDLAVLDVMLPSMNGIDLALVIKANYAQCHVILFSGHAHTGLLLEEAGRRGHQFEILAKPVQPELMLERASELLSGQDESVYN
jgi:CheY-like chemotaxis protein